MSGAVATAAEAKGSRSLRWFGGPGACARALNSSQTKLPASPDWRLIDYIHGVEPLPGGAGRGVGPRGGGAGGRDAAAEVGPGCIGEVVLIHNTISLARRATRSRVGPRTASAGLMLEGTLSPAMVTVALLGEPTVKATLADKLSSTVSEPTRFVLAFGVTVMAAATAPAGIVTEVGSEL